MDIENKTVKERAVSFILKRIPFYAAFLSIVIPIFVRFLLGGELCMPLYHYVLLASPFLIISGNRFKKIKIVLYVIYALYFIFVWLQVVLQGRVW